MLQATVYVGYPKGARAAYMLREVLIELNRLDEITKTQLPLDGTSSKRSKEQERSTWRVPDEKFPEREQYMQKYGWGGISAGIRLQPTHHVQTLRRFDTTFYPPNEGSKNLSSAVRAQNCSTVVHARKRNSLNKFCGRHRYLAPSPQ